MLKESSLLPIQDNFAELADSPEPHEQQAHKATHPRLNSREISAIVATIDHVAHLLNELDDSTTSSSKVLGPIVIDRDAVDHADLLTTVVREMLDDWDEIAQFPQGRRFVMADKFFTHATLLDLDE